MRRSLAVLALLAGVCAPAIGASGALAEDRSQPRDTGLGIRLVDIPTATADDPRTRTYITDHLKPGTVIERRVQILNDGPDPIEVSMYPAAADIAGGDFVGAAGDTQNALSRWTSTSEQSVALQPRDQQLVNVTVKVPPKAPSGEAYAVVWAETTTPPTEDGGVTQVSRVGIRMYLSVGPGGVPASDFTIESMTAARDAQGAPQVQASVHNTGGRALDLSGQLMLSKGPGGLSAGPFEITLGTTLGVDQTEPISISLDENLPDGPWLATITARSGLVAQTAEARLTFPSDHGTAAPVTAEEPAGLPWLPIGLAVAAGILLLAGLLLFVLRGRRRSQQPAAPPPERLPLDA